MKIVLTKTGITAVLVDIARELFRMRQKAQLYTQYGQ